jgi:hypothetical protein
MSQPSSGLNQYCTIYRGWFKRPGAALGNILAGRMLLDDQRRAGYGIHHANRSGTSYTGFASCACNKYGK